MNIVAIPAACSISYLVKNVSLEKSALLSFEKGASFSLGAEGFFVSILNELSKRGNLGGVKIHLSVAEIVEYGINIDSYLCSALFVNICIQNVKILDRYEKDVTDLLLEKISGAVNMDYGVYEGSQSYSLYAFDPYFIQPPVLNLDDTDPSEEDFKNLLSPKIEKCMVGGASDSKEALLKIVNSMSLYVFLKEIWENTIHHARCPHRSLRYIKISRVTYNSLSEIGNAKLPKALSEYLKSRITKNKTKKYLVIDIVDSGKGIFNTLKKPDSESPKIDVIKSAFRRSSTSKIQRHPVNRGLGLFTAMKCAASLKGLVVMTTSGVLCVNYDYTSDLFLDEIQIFEMPVLSDDLSTSLSLIIPV